MSLPPDTESDDGHVTNTRDPVHPDISIVTHFSEKFPDEAVTYSPDPRDSDQACIVCRTQDFVNLPYP